MNRTIALITALMLGLAVGTSAQVKVKQGANPGKVGPGGGTGKLISTKVSGTSSKSGQKTSGKPAAQSSGGTADGVATAPAGGAQ